MAFAKRTYSVLLVSGSDKFNSSIARELPAANYDPVMVVASAGEARRVLLDKFFDLILINTPLADDFGTQFACDLCSNGSSGVAVFVRNEMYDEIYAKMLEFGVMVLEKPAFSQTVQQTLRVMCAARERFKHMEAKQTSIEEKIAEIRLVNHAKWLLIQRLNMKEEDAHCFIEKQAMHKRVSKRDVAESIIKTYE